MDTLVVYVGFAAIGGLLTGYLTGRFARFPISLALWAVCAGGLIIYANRLDAGDGPDSIDPILVLYGILLPFCACVVIASLIGMVARKVLADRTAP